VQSLTKIFAIPGLRLGFAVVEKNLAEKLNAAKDVWNVNFLAQKAGAAALSDEKFLADTKNWLRSEQKFFVENLKKLQGVKIFEPTANFVLMKFETSELAKFTLEKLRQKKILLRSCENFAGLDGRYLRCAIRSHAENLKLLEALEIN
jgi:threonine-phosphate decarboxylase